MVDTVQKIFETVCDAAPHISSGMLHRREYVGEENPSDEKQMEADVWANELLKELITNIEGVGEYASEEEETITDCGEGVSVAVDPLDGSSNIPTNNLVGTIVGIYDKKLPCKGENLVAAFYILYGPLTTVMKAENGEVNEYIIEEKQGDQVEVHEASTSLEIPEPYIYGFGGNKEWTNKFREIESDFSEEYKLRYGGSLVGDFNQMMHHGGIFGYPFRMDAPEGKLRILFECNPMAYIAETAGGSSSDGKCSILEKEVEEIHQRTPFFAGHDKAVEEVEDGLES